MALKVRSACSPVWVLLGMAGRCPVPGVCHLSLIYNVICPETPADPSDVWC